jgi:multisubunit Na+/H+ antiporter MnhC subunit
MFGTNLFFIALGLILKYAVTWTIVGIDLHTVGVILIVVGIAGLLVNLVLLLRSRDGDMPPAGF